MCFCNLDICLCHVSSAKYSLAQGNFDTVGQPPTAKIQHKKLISILIYILYTIYYTFTVIANVLAYVCKQLVIYQVALS